MKPRMLPDDNLESAHDDGGAHSPVPPAYRTPSPAHLRDCVRRYRGTLSADVEQALLDAAYELEAGEEAFAAVVDLKHALQRRLAQTESNLRAALAIRSRLDHPDDARLAGQAPDTDVARRCRDDECAGPDADGIENRDDLAGGRPLSRPPRSPS